MAHHPEQEHGHAHDVKNVSDAGLLWAVAGNVGLSVFEVIAGLISGSVALMADALHNFNDCAALFIAYLARKISRRGADEKYTFSYRRAELIGAMINLTALVVVGLFLVYEALRRFFEPQPLNGGWIMAAAGIALVVDVATAWLLWAMSKGSLNIRAAFVHNLTDALASVAVLIGGAGVYFLGWNWVDPVLTIVIAGYILYLSIGMMRRTVAILTEATPEGLQLADVRTAALGVDGVRDLHHVHVWELNEDYRALEAHLVLEERALARLETIKDQLKGVLKERYEIRHSTLEIEVEGQGCTGEAAALVARGRI